MFRRDPNRRRRKDMPPAPTIKGDTLLVDDPVIRRRFRARTSPAFTVAIAVLSLLAGAAIGVYIAWPSP